MPDIATFDEQMPADELALAARHHETVERLKRSLMMGQAQFIASGKYLYEIKTDELYKYEDSSREVSWQEFCERPDIPIPGSTSDSRIRIANTLVRIYDTFKLNHPVEDDKLAEIGWTKLDILASHIASKGAAELDELLEAGKTLTVQDLRQNLGTGSLKEVMDCDHQNVDTWTVVKCRDCKETISKTKTS